MEKSDVFNPVWKNLVLNKIQFDLNFLPAKIVLARCRVTLKNDSAPEKIEEAVQDLIKLYEKNKDLPNAIKDIKLLLNK